MGFRRTCEVGGLDFVAVIHLLITQKILFQESSISPIFALRFFTKQTSSGWWVKCPFPMLGWQHILVHIYFNQMIYSTQACRREVPMFYAFATKVLLRQTHQLVHPPCRTLLGQDHEHISSQQETRCASGFFLGFGSMHKRNICFSSCTIFCSYNHFEVRSFI